MYREAVESCERWADSTTQQVDLAFNIFFMIYFFIRVTRHNFELGLVRLAQTELARDDADIYDSIIHSLQL